jgi:hypothetical protein
MSINPKQIPSILFGVLAALGAALFMSERPAEATCYKPLPVCVDPLDTSCVPVPTSLPALNTSVCPIKGDWEPGDENGNCGTESCYLIFRCPCGPPLAGAFCV